MLFGKKQDGNNQPQQPTIDPNTLELAKQVDKSIVFHFGYPHKVDKWLLERYNPYVGWDSATSYLTNKGLASLILGLMIQQNLQFAFGLTVEELNRLRLSFITTDLQAEDMAYLRMLKSKDGKLMEMAIKTVIERKDVFEHNTNGTGKKGWFWL